MTTEDPRPVDALLRYTLVAAALTFSVTILYFGRDLFILLFSSVLFAFLLLPLFNALRRLRFPGWSAAMVCCLLIIAAGVGLLWFLGWQYGHFARDLPQLREGLDAKFAWLQRFVDDRLHVGIGTQKVWAANQVDALAARGGSIAMGVFSATGAVLAVMLLIPVFTFLLLVLKDKFRTFLVQVGGDQRGTALKVVVRSAELSRKYLRGVLTVMVILSVLNSVGFLLLGLQYAILLGVTAAILNIVPYVGPWVGSILPILIALITKDSAWYAVGAMGVILVSQFIDNNLITPKIVGSSVSINPLACLVSLLAGGMLWGTMGLILAIPITGMLKILCDEIPGLKPWGYLLGEERTWPSEQRIQMPFMRRKPGAPQQNK